MKQIEIISLMIPPSKSIYIKLEQELAFSNYNLLYLPLILRDYISKKGKKINSIGIDISFENPISDEDIIKIIMNELFIKKFDKTIILGFPRTKNQLVDLNKAMENNKIGVDFKGVFFQSQYSSLENHYNDLRKEYKEQENCYFNFLDIDHFYKYFQNKGAL